MTPKDPRALIAEARNWLAVQSQTPIIPLGEHYTDLLATALADALERAEIRGGDVQPHDPRNVTAPHEFMPNSVSPSLCDWCPQPRDAACHRTTQLHAFVPLEFLGTGHLTKKCRVPLRDVYGYAHLCEESPQAACHQVAPQGAAGVKAQPPEVGLPERAASPSAPSLHYCNKCGDFGDSPEHGGCRYLAAKVPPLTQEQRAYWERLLGSEPAAPSADLALIEELEALPFSRGQASVSYGMVSRLLALAREALAGREVLTRLTDANWLRDQIMGLSDSDLDFDLTNSCKRIISAARSAAGEK